MDNPNDTGDVVKDVADEVLEQTQANPLSLSDEDFMNYNSPSDIPVTTAEPVVEAKPETEAAAEVITDPAKVETDPTKVGKDAEISDNKSEQKVGNTVDNKPEPTVPAKAASTAVDDKTGKQKEVPSTEKNPADTGVSIDHQAFYEQVMKPFKANGKMVELRSAEEAIALMQQGANYTRKMQDLGQHRKTIMMLENNGLLDNDKLAYLIDLDKKNPEAIKKLIKDSGINPLDIDPDEEVNYLKGNHEVSDEEANFRTTVNELNASPEGMETAQIIHSTWDQASKEVLWKSPQIMTIMNEQRSNGIYDRITNEVARQKMLGQIDPNASFLQAYKQVGDQLTASGGFDDLNLGSKPAAPAKQEQQKPAPIDTKVGGVKAPVVKNGDKASAAAQTRTTPNQTGTQVNPLSLSDEDFMKQVNGRL